MDIVHALLVMLHVITAAAWFGIALRLGAQGRKVASYGDDNHETRLALAAEGSHSVRLMGIFLLLTFVFSMGILALGGGYPDQTQYHIASALIVVLIATHYFLIRPAWMRLSSDSDSAKGAAKRLVMGVGMGHLIWLTLIVLMFWNRFSLVWYN